MNRQPIKIQVAGELRKIYKVPRYLDELKEYIKEFLGIRELFEIEFKVEDCLIRLASNKDYQKYVIKNPLEKSLRLILSSTCDKETPPSEIFIGSCSGKLACSDELSTITQNPESEQTENNKTSYLHFTNIHEKVSCSECKISPIAGIRFKCVCCPNFDICEFCEDILDHPHPFLKLKSPIQCYQNYMKIISAFNKSSLLTGLKDLLVKKVKDPCKKKFKLKVKHYLFKKLACFNVGSNIQLAWDIVNKGTQVWPAGSKLVLKKGEFACEDFVLGEQVEPGVNVVVRTCVKAPEEAKEFLGVWEIDTGAKRFGKISAQFKTVDNERVKEMASSGYGFTKVSSIKSK